MRKDESGSKPFATKEPSLLMDVKAVARQLGCSPRHVWRMADSGDMPPPVQLGALKRWKWAELEEWIAGGCKPLRRK